MTKYFALVVNGTVNEVITDPVMIDGVAYPIDEVYHPLVIAMLVECPEWVVQMATYDGTTFTNPPVVGP